MLQTQMFPVSVIQLVILKDDLEVVTRSNATRAIHRTSFRVTVSSFAKQGSETLKKYEIRLLRLHYKLGRSVSK